MYPDRVDRYIEISETPPPEVEVPVSPAEEKPPVDLYVYFIQSGELVKIGTSRDPRKRFQTLRLGSPAPLRLLACIPGGRPEERALHNRFARCRRHGEWFDATAELLEFIHSLRESLNV